MKKTFADFGIDLNGRSGIEVKTTCPQCSHARKKKTFPCLNVNTEKGVWHCWHCDWAGSLTQGEERHSDVYERIKRNYRRPAYHEPFYLDSKALGWLTSRGLTREVIERAKIGWGRVYMPQLEREVYAIQFPYFRDGECVNVKYRDLAKNFRMAAGAERVLYGLDDIDSACVIIVEGEIDKLSFAAAGLRSCVSVPDGAPAPNTKNYASKFSYLEADEARLSPVQKFTIATDADEPGRTLADELARRLGLERCYRVVWPEGCKDANEVLLSDGTDALRVLIEAAQPYPVKGLFTVLDIADRARHVYEHGLPRSEPTAWRALVGLYSVRTGEWTVVTGIPSHGKTEWLDALMLNLIRGAGWRFGVFSAENLPLELHFSKLAEKLIGKPFARGPSPRMCSDELEQAIEELHEYVSFILPEHPTLDHVLDLAKVLVFRRGIKGLIIDPWNELDHSRAPNLTETEYVSQSLSKIRAFARAHAVHVFVVAHPTKLTKDKSGRYPVPTPYDISGSAHWRNKADNCVCVWRELTEDNRVVEIHVQKVRFKDVGRVGKAELIYHRPSGRYFDLGEAPEETVYGFSRSARGAAG
ncbi:MAG: toprim domain-containing protein [Gammaproteobacteria bacterium]